MKTKLSLQLPSHLQTWVAAQATAQGFDSPGEYVCHLLIEHRRTSTQKAIDKKLVKALDSNQYVDLTDEHYRQLDQRLSALAKTNSKKRHAPKR